eukprot:597578-Pelagomonas_calceolata.AAC.4
MVVCHWKEVHSSSAADDRKALFPFSLGLWIDMVLDRTCSDLGSELRLAPEKNGLKILPCSTRCKFPWELEAA